MEYNTSKNTLHLPEYGRNVQMMAEHIISLEDRDTRTKAAHEIVNIMGNMFPHLKETKDYKIKLWDHLAFMTRYQLDVDYPYTITVVEEQSRGEKVSYNTNHIKYRHYGKVVQRLVQKAIDFEDSEEKIALILTIANHMKKQYLIWNKNSVTDEIILEDLRLLSDYKLDIPDGLRLVNTNTGNPTTNIKKGQPQKKNIKRKR